MVSSRDIGILAIIGIGALALFKKVGGVNFESVPTTPQNILFGQALQAQFDELGNVIEEQNTALEKAQQLLKLKFQQPKTSLNFKNIPSGSLLGISLGPALRTDPRKGPTNQSVINFGKVPSNIRGGPRL